MHAGASLPRTRYYNVGDQGRGFKELAADETVGSGFAARIGYENDGYSTGEDEAEAEAGYVMLGLGGVGI